MKPAMWYISGFLVVVLYLYLSAIQYVRGIQVDFSYHNYEHMTKLLQDISREHPDFALLYSIGKSVQGRSVKINGTCEMVFPTVYLNFFRGIYENVRKLCEIENKKKNVAENKSSQE
ncbi:hypothetical protein AVEN_35780-1 [Araneus ventricosus]|uniref:Uncharacterized protein n=1 Tax=Araneus ventricosus TaxID=182803 RepID=A0A4Y2T0X8_ARAVE|nr:hypothetical protein AVEN_35780-1 [Araneus ventricosus]